MTTTIEKGDIEKQELRKQQLEQAEELLFAESHPESFAKQLYHGHFAQQMVFPYPQLAAAESEGVTAALDELRRVCDRYLDAEQIDRQADIPAELIHHLGRIGLLGMTAPESAGGRGFSQLAYCHLLEELGSRCSSTSIFVNAHHSIGMRGLLLFGNAQQKQRWLPDLVSGKAIAAFALTEVQAGSDAANVQTTATPAADGSHYLLNGSKRYITNGAIAKLLTVMARTPIEGSDKSAVTAFLVTPDMPGFKVVDPRMEKLGIRGTATAKLEFENMRVPAENMLGREGKGLRVALTVLDFGRTTFGACCSGAARRCLQLANRHARTRIQFGQPIGAFELVQKKLARMAADLYAMQAMTHMTAGLIDRGSDDYMLETAILKVWTTERLWKIVNETFQIYGGAAYFTDQPLERMLRDARINQIGEGANEVLTSFIGLVGMRDPGERLRRVAQSLHAPWKSFGVIGQFVVQEFGRRLGRPKISTRSDSLGDHARWLSNAVKRFGLSVQRELIRHREEILDRQLVHERIACAAMELFASTAVIGRMDHELQTALSAESVLHSHRAARLFLRQSRRRFEDAMAGDRDNDDVQIREVAESLSMG